MRKILFNLILLVILVSAFAGNLYASDDNVKVYINEKIVSFPDAEPYIDFNGRTQVPIRFISEAL
ncbi:MAG TPA: stalk domain-containing protein, partial [Acetivibrio sp.]|nr:stalk domain-containing protein [Acetivibrio sp.]